AALEAETMAETQGLEPCLLEFHLLVDEGEVQVAAEIAVHVGGHDQFGMVEGEAARRLAVAMAVAMAVGGQKAGDMALAAGAVDPGALQDEGHLRVETGLAGGQGGEQGRDNRTAEE